MHLYYYRDFNSTNRLSVPLVLQRIAKHQCSWQLRYGNVSKTSISKAFAFVIFLIKALYISLNIKYNFILVPVCSTLFR